MKRSITVLLAMAAALTGVAAAQTLPLAAGDGWEVRLQGHWKTRWDHRELLAIRHPWEPSEKGGFAQVSRHVDVPGNWTGPVSLAFYCSDDYQAAGLKPDASWLTAEGFTGHRFKQVLVDGKVVWSQDVSDAVSRDPGAVRFRVPLPVAAGQKFLLSLLVYDSEASATRLPEDFYQSGDSGLSRDADPGADRFMTHVYFGDLALTGDETSSLQGRRPSESRVLEIHNRRWPLPPFGEEWKGDTVPLTLDLPASAIPSLFPVRQGLPLPVGRVSDVQNVRLQSRDGAAIPVQKAVLSRWPDDSIRWLGVDFLGKAGMKDIALAFKKDRSEKSAGVKVQPADDGTRVDTGRIRFRLGGDAVISALENSKGVSVVERVDLSLSTGGEEITVTADSVEVIEAGPIRSTFRLDGRFDTVDRRLGSLAVYLNAYAGQPYLNACVRVFNDTSGNLPISSLSLKVVLPAIPDLWRVPSGAISGNLAIAQPNEKERVVNGVAVDAAAPLFVAWPDGAAVVRHFRELFPKAVRSDGQTLTILLVDAPTAPIVFTPGEAISHEIWLELGAADPAALAALIHEPPLLSNPEYFCATGVLGPARTHAETPALRDHMQQTYAKRSWAELGQFMGIRHFPDSPYLGGLPQWSNDYYGRMLNLWSEWFMSGDRAWFDRATDVCRHLMDVAVIHSDVPGKDWRGAMHGPGDNHVAGPWAPTLRTAGLELYQKLTLDPEAQAAHMDIADYCVRSGAGLDSDSIRQHAGPFDTICTAYWDTGDVAFLDEGTKRVGKVMAHLDRRRGVWPDTHGSRVYCGNVPWMAAQLARPLYWWYALTGDVEAAQALVALAESMICENTDWDNPGVVSAYSHNPRYAVTARYDLMVVPMILAAHELTEDSFFLDAAKAQWRRWLDAGEFDSVFNVYWNTPWLMWQLHRFGMNREEPPAPAESNGSSATQSNGGGPS